MPIMMNGIRMTMNNHTGNMIKLSTAIQYRKMARKDRANGWAKASSQAANATAHRKYYAAKMFYVAWRAAGRPPF